MFCEFQNIGAIIAQRICIYTWGPSLLFNKLLSPHPTAHLIWKKTHSLYSIDLNFAVLQFNMSSAVVCYLLKILKYCCCSV